MQHFESYFSKIFKWQLVMLPPLDTISFFYMYCFADLGADWLSSIQPSTNPIEEPRVPPLHGFHPGSGFIANQIPSHGGHLNETQQLQVCALTLLDSFIQLLNSCKCVAVFMVFFWLLLRNMVWHRSALMSCSFV